MQAFQTSVFLRVKINTQAPSTRIRLSLNPQLFLSGYCFRPHVPVNQAYKSTGNLWTGKFDLNSDTCGRGNFFFSPERKSYAFKDIRIHVDGPLFSRFRQTHRKHEAEYDMKNRYAYRGGCYQQSPLAKQTCRTAGYRDINRG